MKAPFSRNFVRLNPHAAPAFTLIELLVVVSIIALLAGILLPVTSSVMEKAKKTSAKNTETQIAAAIRSYQSDYAAYPTFTGSTSGADTTVGGTTSSNAPLFAVLRASDDATNSSNTKRVVYFEGKDAKTPTKPVDGFVPSGATLTGNNGNGVSVGDLVDPWGNRYFICFDSGYSDQVLNPYVQLAGDDGGGTFEASRMLQAGVIVWSWGKDGQRGNKGTVTGSAPSFASYGDDVLSWQ